MIISTPSATEPRGCPNCAGACNICQFCPCAWCNPSRLREQICDLINRAMPGLRLYKDGTMEMYVPSTEETDAFQDLVDAIMDFK